MKYFRKTIFWLHLAAGLFAGLVVLIMSVTGVLLTYERQIISWADSRTYSIAPSAAATGRLPVETLIAKAGEGQQAPPTTITLRNDPGTAAAFAFSGGRMVFVNPYTGEVLGEGAKGVREFFRVVTDWHRWLGASGESRAIARGVTGACNLAFLFLVVSGFYLWWPRKANRASIKNVLWFRRRLPGKARDFNWHNVIGFWSAVPLFVVVLSAVVISYTWAGNLVYRIVGEEPPAARASGGAPPAPASRNGGEGSVEAKPQEGGLDRMMATAELQVPDWRSISLRIPASDASSLAFTIDAGSGGQPQKRGQLTLDRTTGEIVKWEPFSSNTRGRQLRSILRFAHTGEVAGLVGQTVAGIVSAGAVVLVWTGLALAFWRFRGWLARSSRRNLESTGSPESRLGGLGSPATISVQHPE